MTKKTEILKQQRIEKREAEAQLDKMARDYAMAHNLGYHAAYAKVAKLNPDIVTKTRVGRET